MINLPDISKVWDYENNFYLTCDITRVSKILAHYELFKMVNGLPGAIVECGVFKGTGLIKFATFRELFGGPFSHKIIGFDMFGKFPETDYEEDKKYRNYLIETESAGDQSLSKEQLLEILRNKGIESNVELVEGDIIKTVPEYIEKNPHLKLSLVNLDTDIYEPAVTILECLWPRIVKGGVLILDDYATFPGETKAVDEYFKGKNIKIQKFPFVKTPCYVIKEE